jgi:hypothetical protein
MSIASNQKKYLQSLQLEELGTDGDIHVVLNSQLDKALYRYGQQLIPQLRSNLEKDKTVASGELKRSLNFATKTVSNSLLRFEVRAADYWIDVNDGKEAGTVVEIDDIVDWIAHKGIKVRESSAQSTRSVMEKSRSLASLIARAIYTNGTISRFNYGGTGFLTKEINDQALVDLSLYLTQITGKTILLSMQNNFKDN